MTLLRYPSQGQQIVLGWSNEVNLKNWTAYLGSDGEPFLPPTDRNGFSDGVDRPLPTGRVLMAGLPIARLTFPWLSYGQVDYLETTFDGQNVTVAIHKPSSLTTLTTVHYNAVCNVDLNQAQNLSRKGNGYESWVVRFVLVEPL
jgi:hypothetical protein